MAGFLHSIPLIMDELQLARDPHGKINFNVYELASGSGKIRSNVGRGLAPTPRWANCFITSRKLRWSPRATAQEQSTELSKSSAKPTKKLSRTDTTRAPHSKQTMGSPGRYSLRNCGWKQSRAKLYEYYYEDCLTTNTTEKQRWPLR